MWHLWQDQTHVIGSMGALIAFLVRLLNFFVLKDAERREGRRGKCNWLRDGDNGLAGEMGPERIRRADGWRGVKKDLLVGILISQLMILQIMSNIIAI